MFVRVVSGSFGKNTRQRPHARHGDERTQDWSADWLHHRLLTMLVRRRRWWLAGPRRRTGIAIELVGDAAGGKFVRPRILVVADGKVFTHLHHREYAAHFQRPELAEAGHAG